MPPCHDYHGVALVCGKTFPIIDCLSHQLQVTISSFAALQVAESEQ
jgi:hypothetical protein